MQTPTMIARDAKHGLEVWQTWDAGAEVFELWASPECNDYIGCADTRAEAQRIAREWLVDYANF